MVQGIGSLLMSIFRNWCRITWDDGKCFCKCVYVVDRDMFGYLAI